MPWKTFFVNAGNKYGLSHRIIFDPNVEKMLSFSIGATFDQVVDIGLHEILEQSDVAMYYVKKHGKGKYIVYDEIRNRIEEERALKERALTHR